MTKQTSIIVQARVLVLCSCVAAASGCMSVKADNKPPTAVASALLNGQPVIAGTPIPFMDQPVVITLDGSHSSDADGSLTTFIWRRTDVSAAARFMLMPAGAAGMAAASGTGGMAAPPKPSGPAFVADPAPTAMSQVTLTEKGTYRFSLWVKDNKGAVSAPSSVTLKVGGFMPDATCMTAFTQPKAECQACTCTPNAMGGCLDQINACLNNADPTFKMLCTAVVNCAVMKSCAAAACYTAANCMAEIDAASMYMGGTIAACNDATMVATNPCAASGALATCQGMPTCADVCK
jgi:hypothetical protein